MSNTEALRTAAQAVLDRWDSPQWEWTKQSPTADLMHALRVALAQPAAPVVAWHMRVIGCDGSADWCELGAKQPEPAHGVEALPMMYAQPAASGEPADHVPAGPEAEAATDAALGLVLLPPIRVDRATHAALQESARARGLIVQAIVRERLAPYTIPGATAQPAPARVPLTNGDLLALWGSRSDGPDSREIVSYARAVLAAAPGAPDAQPTRAEGE